MVDGNSFTDRIGRRNFVAGLTSTVVGTALVNPVSSRSVPSPTDLFEDSWTKTVLVEGDNATYVSSELRYVGTQVQLRPDEEVYYAHLFDLVTLGRAYTESDGDVYNITSQEFEANLGDGDVFFNVLPNNGYLGAAAWPNPPGGNWDAAIDSLLQSALGAVSDVVSVALSASQIENQLGSSSFDAGDMKNLQYQDEYSVTRTTSAHGVQFIADQEKSSYDQPPCTGDVCPTNTVSSSDMFPNALAITTGISKGDAFWETQVEFDLTLGGEGVFKPEANSSSESASSPDFSGVNEMSNRELQEAGVLKIEPGESDTASTMNLAESQRRLAEAFMTDQQSGDEPIYLTTMPIGVDVNAIGGSIVDTN